MHKPTLPRQLTAFVGRTHELSKIQALLLDPNCRLLTLVGAGGIGKTRLALEAAATLFTHFADGATVVALQDATNALALVNTTVRALHCPLAGSQDPQTQLLNFLSDKNLLLVLDNLEQLVDEAGWLTTLLAAVPGVKVLATSREVLNLTNEWLLSVDGLPVPDEHALAQHDVEAFAQYDAMQLFVERARRVRVDFSLAEEGIAVVRICQLVGGMPLAIEVAAAWLKTLTCAEVVGEIQQNFDFLTTNQRDVAPRHRSIRAVCDHSWQRLPATERSVYMALAVFAGSFQRHAAQVVAGATLTILATLVEKSLLRWEPDTRRYQMHQLLRQYALEHLIQAEGALEQMKGRHCEYYVEFMRDQGQAILVGEQLAAVAAIDAELDNVRAAWEWAVAAAPGARRTELVTLARNLVDYYQIRSRYGEGAAMLAQALSRLRRDTTGITPALALLLTYHGSLLIRLGRIDEADALLQEAYAYQRATDVPPMPGYNTDPAFSLGIVALIQGNYAAATRLGEEVRQRSAAHAHAQNGLLAHYLLASAALAQGELNRAQTHAEQACALARALASHWFEAYCLIELGNIAFAQGDYGAARTHYSASYTIRQVFEDPEGMALALVRLGETALAQNDEATARDLFVQGQTLYQRIGDQGGLTAAYAGLGRAAVGLQAWGAARTALHQALTLALAIHYVPYLGSILFGAAFLLLGIGQRGEGVKLLAAIARHPTTPRSLVEQMQRKLSDDLSYLAPDFLAASQALSVPIDLEALASRLLPVLAQVRPLVTSSPIPDSSQSLPTTAAPAESPLISPLVESLSERELELLRLLAAGLKNREIATQMVISVNTVKVHINNIYGKLGVSSRVQAVARAQELMLL